MNFKVLISSIIAGSTLLTIGTTSSVNASGACDNAPRGEKLQRTGPNSWRVYATVRKSVKSRTICKNLRKSMRINKIYVDLRKSTNIYKSI